MWKIFEQEIVADAWWEEIDWYEKCVLSQENEESTKQGRLITFFTQFVLLRLSEVMNLDISSVLKTCSCPSGNCVFRILWVILLRQLVSKAVEHTDIC